MRFALAALLALLLPLATQAGYDSGNRLYEDCSSENYFNRGYCGGYITGVVDTIESMQKSGQLPRKTLCIPDEVTKGQLADAVKMYLGNNPSRRHLDAGSLVPEALQRSFPCDG